MRDKKKFEHTKSKEEVFNKPKDGFKGNKNRNFRNPKENQDLAGNHPAWWKKYPALMDIASKFSWRTIPGLRVLSPDGVADYYNKTGVRVKYTPTVGLAEDATSPVNLVFRDLWLAMHKNYRGLGRYEQADLACMVIGTAGFYADVALAERAYALCFSYQVQNRAIPEQVLRACNIDAALQDSIQQNAADFRYQLNMLIERAKGLLIPKGMTALYNWISLNGNIYKDGDANNAQYIAFVPTHSIAFDTLATSGSCLRFTTDNDYGGFSSYQDIIDYLRNELSYLLAEEDIAIMCSDLLAYYGAENVEYLQPMPENFIIAPIKDDSILLKLHNASGTLDQIGKRSGGYVYGLFHTKISNAYPTSVVSDLPSSVTAGDDFIVYQEDNNLHADYFLSGTLAATPTIKSPTYGTKTVYVNSEDGMTAANQNPSYFMKSLNNVLMDTWNDNPTADEFMEGSLWAVPTGSVTLIGTGHNTSYPSIHILTCSTEIIRSVTVIGANRNISRAVIAQDVPFVLDDSNVTLTIVVSSLETGNSGVAGAMAGFSYLSKVDWAPLVYPLTVTGATNATGDYIITTTKRFEPIGDTTNFKWVSVTDVRLVHDCALLSGFTMDAITNLQ